MPYCTIEEAWGENIYNTPEQNNTRTQSALYTDKLQNSTEEDYLRPKEHTEFIVDKGEDIENRNIHKNKNKDIDKAIHTAISKDVTSLKQFIEDLKKENEELKRIISNQSANTTKEKQSIKFKIIDILIYILTGIFIIFIIKIIFKHNIKRPYIQESVF